MRRAFVEYLDRPAAQLSRQVVIDLLDRMAESGCVAMHIRVRAYGHACYRWALRRGKVPSNPFADLPDYGGVRARDRMLSDEELGAVWRAAEAMPYPFGPLIRLLALTLCRRAEAAKMRWSEVSRDLTTWTIPAERMKRGRPHVVALPAAARAILAGPAALRRLRLGLHDELSDAGIRLFQGEGAPRPTLRRVGLAAARFASDGGFRPREAWCGCGGGRYAAGASTVSIAGRGESLPAARFRAGTRPRAGGLGAARRALRLRRVRPRGCLA